MALIFSELGVAPDEMEGFVHLDELRLSNADSRLDDSRRFNPGYNLKQA